MSAGLSARSVRHTEGVDKVRALQRVLYRSAKQNRTRRFHALYDKVARSDVLWRAWLDVAANAGTAGVDGVTVGAIADAGVAGVRAFLDELARQLESNVYRPQPLRRVHIPKPGKPGQTRPLGIPTVRDRVVMTAAKLVLEPVFEADFAACSFGFRPKRSAHDAIDAIRVEVNRGRNWVLDADIMACFDNIDHGALIAHVERRVSDRNMLKLLWCWLRAGIFEGGVVSDVEAGTPQGSPISPLLANIALHVLDEAWQSERSRIGVLVRYADDLVVLCATRAKAEQGQQRVAAILAGLGLRLHPDKTRIADLHKGAQGFDFLGFHHRKVESWKWRGKYYLQSWPSDRAMNSIRAKIRDRTDRRHVGRSVEAVVADLNPVLRGWGIYFGRGNSAKKFSHIDSYVHMRLAMFASTKHGLRGLNWQKRFSRSWMSDLGVYQLGGKVRYRTAHA
ncbi:group II intron reverse transcriptase/maturase [soil metagenome]